MKIVQEQVKQCLRGLEYKSKTKGLVVTQGYRADTQATLKSEKLTIPLTYSNQDQLVDLFHNLVQNYKVNQYRNEKGNECSWTVKGNVLTQVLVGLVALKYRQDYKYSEYLYQVALTDFVKSIEVGVFNTNKESAYRWDRFKFFIPSTLDKEGNPTSYIKHFNIHTGTTTSFVCMNEGHLEFNTQYALSFQQLLLVMLYSKEVTTKIRTQGLSTKISVYDVVTKRMVKLDILDCFTTVLVNMSETKQISLLNSVIEVFGFGKNMQVVE